MNTERNHAGSNGSSAEAGTASQYRVIGDLRAVIENAEDLLKNTDHYNHGLYHTARNKLAEALLVATEELERCEEAQLARMLAATSEANRLHGDRDGEARVLRAFH
ncbi:hypothetical protein [Pseudoduganella buxea]|uniref:DUF883 domain-containing protein n=1 Tax=Pseudoduganella buxea TaxID=1949069 RepID=A0A6I3T7I4_9BURK|nr:hypothetical protein [Pseudoduganella buxea]MTV56332.1 hypothetical protein [Pseudoduganella buxea]GGC03727.1 hypothetical protein GCM10011572_27140 [Pseudoduganella buxea]